LLPSTFSPYHCCPASAYPDGSRRSAHILNSTTTACFQLDGHVDRSQKMHQHPRPSPMTASPASSPRTNPTRTNNPREEGSSPHTRTNSDMPVYSEGDDGSGDSGVMPSNGPSKDSVKKLDQIIQVGNRQLPSNPRSHS